jgi:hypothetical protein
MRIKLHNLIFLFMALGVVVGILLSGTDGPSDRNGDGFVSQQEFERHGDAHDDRSRAFERSDEDRDGTLSRAEFIGNTPTTTAP